MTYAFTVGDTWRWGMEPMGTVGADDLGIYHWCWARHFGPVTLCITNWKKRPL